MIWVAQILLTILFPMAFGEVLPSATEQSPILLTGRVTSAENGTPLANVAVVLVDNTFPIEYFEEARTDASGYYTVTLAHANTWWIRFEPPTNDYLTEYYNDTYDKSSATVFTTAPGLVLNGIDAALSPRGHGQINGQVSAEHGGAPLKDVAVDLYDAAGKWLRGPFLTDSNGVYTVTEVPSGSVKLRFDGALTSSYYLAEYYNDKEEAAEADEIVVESNHVQGIDASLDVGGAIDGSVTSSWGNRPIDRVAVELYNSDGELVRRLTAFRGFYFLPNLPAGAYRLHFTDLDSHHRAEYDGDQQTLEQAPPVQVNVEQTTANVNAQLTLIPELVSVATNRGAANTVIVAYAHDPAPHFTTDGGQHWQAVPSTPWLEGVYDPLNPIRFAGAEVGIATQAGENGGTRLLYSVGQQIYVSTDLGQSWTPRAGYTCIGVGTVEGFVVDPTNPSQIYLHENCDDGDAFRFIQRWLWFSPDAGDTWQNLFDSEGWPQAIGVQLVPSPVVAGRLYLDGGEKWYYRADSGAAWVERNFPVLTVVPDAEDPELLYGWSKNAAPALVGTRSEDGGDHWVNWQQQPCPTPFRLLAHPTETEVLIVRCLEGLFGSNDGGDSWRGLTTTGGRRLAPDYGTTGRILWVMDDGRLASSANNGVSWQTLQAHTPLYLPNIKN